MARLSSLDKIGMLRSSLGDPATGDVPDAELAQFIWLAEMDIASEIDFPELRDHEDLETESGVFDYELDATDILDFLKPANDITGGYPLKLKDDEWDRRVGIHITDGAPFFYFPNGVGPNGRKNIRVRPIPTDVRTIRIPYVRVPTAPDSENATFSELPISFDLQVLSRAAEIGLQMTGERAEAGVQGRLTGKAAFRAEKTVPPKAYYVNRILSFSDRMRRRRRF